MDGLSVRVRLTTTWKKNYNRIGKAVYKKRLTILNAKLVISKQKV